MKKHGETRAEEGGGFGMMSPRPRVSPIITVSEED